MADGKRSCFNAQCVTSLFLVAAVVAQVLMAFFVMNSTELLAEEWPRVLKAHGQKIMVVEKSEFWGPVHVLVPTSCRRATKWDHKLEDVQEDLAAPDEKTTVRLLDNKTDNVNRKGQKADRHQGAGEDQVPKTAAKRKKTEKAKDMPAEKTQEGDDKKKKAEADGEEDGKAQAKKMANKKDAVEHVSKLRRLRKSSMPPPAAAREMKMIIPKFIPNVSICINGKETVTSFNGPTYWNRYFSMISLSMLTTGGTTSMAKLHASRQFTYKSLFLLLMVTMAGKYSLKLIDISSGCCGHKYVQLWNGGRTTMDKMIESLMIHGVSVVFTLAMQLTLCTLFLTCWDENHGYFIMSYIPGVGFVLFFGSFVCFTFVMVLDRVRQTMLNASNTYIYCFWFLWVFWMFSVCIPMLGYSVYVLQFVTQVVNGHMLHTQPFSEEFVKHSRHVCHCAGLFASIAVAELVIILKLDLEEGKSRPTW